MLFFFITFVGMYIGRRFGWFFSRHILYATQTYIAMLACIFWGILVAVYVHALIQWQQPNLILKLIMGYAAGGYLAVPNFGLFSPFPKGSVGEVRDTLTSVVPEISYILSLIALALFATR